MNENRKNPILRLEILIVAAGTVSYTTISKAKQPANVILLTESEHVSLDIDLSTNLGMKYFYTTPTAFSMCILKTGVLFVAPDLGNQYVLIAWLALTTATFSTILSELFVF